MDCAFRFYHTPGDQGLDSRADRGRRLAKKYVERWMRDMHTFYKARGLSAVVADIVEKMRSEENFVEMMRRGEDVSKLLVEHYSRL
jgi:predicted DNA-binding protein (UPF0278 family)